MTGPLFDLTGKVAFVTGGNGGIGKAIARGFLDAGAEAAIAGRKEKKNAQAQDELSEAGSVRAYTLDVARRDAIEAVVTDVLSDFGRIDILVNNAGIAAPSPVAMMQDQVWRQVLDINLTGTFHCAQVIGKHMIARKQGGKIINLASEYSQFGGAMVSAYAASKGGVVQFTKSLAVEWAPNNICVNALAPGWIETDMTRAAVHSGLGKRIVDRTPMKRWGMPDDMIGAAVFLAAPASDFITGQVLAVDGGWNISG